eukprot:gene32450-31064_t
MATVVETTETAVASDKPSFQKKMVLTMIGLVVAYFGYLVARPFMEEKETRTLAQAVLIFWCTFLFNLTRRIIWTDPEEEEPVTDKKDDGKVSGTRMCMVHSEKADGKDEDKPDEDASKSGEKVKRRNRRV